MTGLNGMVEFELQLLTDPRLFGLIAAHGCVDFARPDLLAVYTLAAVPLGSVPTTLGFLSSSLIHFGRDLGVALSVVLHALAGLVYLKDPNVAFSLMMAYSLIWHIPSLYVRLVASKQFAPLALALGASLAGFLAAGSSAFRSAVPLLRSGHLHFSHLLQRIVICHIVVHELSHRKLSLGAAVNSVWDTIKGVIAGLPERVYAFGRWRQRRRLMGAGAEPPRLVMGYPQANGHRLRHVPSVAHTGCRT